MERKTTRARSALKRPGKYFLRVVVGFQRNQGLLLAGAVAYYTLLSIIPMLALILVGHVSLRYALAGGITASILWEIVLRYRLDLYFGFGIAD